MKIGKGEISAVLVYLERRKSRKLVGALTHNGKEYIFQYDKEYLRSKLIPLGPELPLTRKRFVSKNLFESFVDRLPSRENPAYVDYCASVGIDINEADPFVLLTTIGKRGASSFIFEALREKVFGASDVIAFRKELHLTTREFAIGFAISAKTLISIEKGKSEGRDVMKRLELYIRFPEVALFEFQRNCGKIHRDKRRLVEQVLRKKI